MTPTEYTRWQVAIDLYPQNSQTCAYYALGLTGEAGEVAEKVKKSYRDNVGIDMESMKKELGDVLWYVTAIARHMGYSLQDIIDANVKKLEDRHKRGVGRGSGDDR